CSTDGADDSADGAASTARLSDCRPSSADTRGIARRTKAELTTTGEYAQSRAFIGIWLSVDMQAAHRKLRGIHGRQGGRRRAGLRNRLVSQEGIPRPFYRILPRIAILRDSSPCDRATALPIHANVLHNGCFLHGYFNSEIPGTSRVF